MQYILGIDQSTQGTKLILFDEGGSIVTRVDRPHRQIISDEGYVSHDMNEVWRNILDGLHELLDQQQMTGGEIASVGISNQRETTVAWGDDGKPLALAIVWQCARAAQIAADHGDDARKIQQTTGLALSPFYPAAKMQWLLENDASVKAAAEAGSLHLGTVDSYIVYRMTKGQRFATDASNASRCQLMDIHTVDWSEDMLSVFGLKRSWLPAVTSSNGDFGVTDFGGILPHPIPIRGVMGDSHCALFGHGCHKPGMTKVTYGTGSSVMMNTGEMMVEDPTLSTSVAWQIDGKTSYCLEGNINYTGAVNSWLKDDVHLFENTREINELIAVANPDDHTVVIPAFTGLSAPWWNADARAAFLNMSRTTGKAEIVKAANESIAMQITDVMAAMEKAAEQKIPEIHVDGGPTKNTYLMQYQADMADCEVIVPKDEELSAIGAAYMAGLTVGVYKSGELFHEAAMKTYAPQMDSAKKQALRRTWKHAMQAVIAMAEAEKED